MEAFRRTTTARMGALRAGAAGLARTGGFHHTPATSALNERLEEVLVMELLQDGGRNYLTLSVRSLYKHVLNAITNSTAPEGHLSPVIEEENSASPFAKSRSKPPVDQLDPMLEPLPPIGQKIPESYSGVSSESGHLNPEIEISFQDEPVGAPLPEPPPLPPGAPPEPSLFPTISQMPGMFGGAILAMNNQRLPGARPKKSGRRASVGEVFHGPGVTYRERLGGYLHPRDMRKLVTPFSASNEPELIVRRHAMLFNFDPLRCIILRDRVLVLVPDGADSILADLERIVRGGKKEMELACFGKDVDEMSNVTPSSVKAATGHTQDTSANNTKAESSTNKRLWGRLVQSISGGKKNNIDSLDDDEGDYDMSGTGHSRKSKHHRYTSIGNPSDLPGEISETESLEGDNNGEIDESEDLAAAEWDDIAGQAWIELPFELQCTDAVLQTVVGILSEDTSELQQATLAYIDEIINGKLGSVDSFEDPLTVIRAIKDSVREMLSRTKGFVQSMNTILDDYEDMALMNLSRLITHPERFIQPVPAEVLEEESDEPELILESYLQQGLSLINGLHLIQGQIDTAAELIDQKLDATRNKILLANTIISTVALGTNFSTLIAGFFGMNVVNHIEDSESAFIKIICWTVSGSFLLFCGMMAIMYQTGAIPRWGRLSSS